MSHRDEEWFQAICGRYTGGRDEPQGIRLPGFPPDEVQINTTGQAGVPTLREAFVFYQDCREAFRTLAQPAPAPTDRLLDFGVGWGRTARFFLREIAPDRLYGIDVDADLIAICRETFDSTNFTVCNPFPPTLLPSGFFRYVVGYSVFSHLSAAACRAWMTEFARIVSPGGIVALTTRGRSFFDYCEAQRGQGHTGYRGALGELFPDFAAARARFDHGELVHSNIDAVTGGGPRNGDFYGETFIPREYAATEYSAWFDLVGFRFDSTRHSHPVMLFRRK